MDVTQHNLRNLLHETDRAFNLLIQHPSSATHAAKYELAKTALNEYLCVMRHSLHKKTKYMPKIIGIARRRQMNETP
jgi:hypothetical protein